MKGVASDPIPLFKTGGLTNEDGHFLECIITTHFDPQSGMAFIAFDFTFGVESQFFQSGRIGYRAQSDWMETDFPENPIGWLFSNFQEFLNDPETVIEEVDSNYFPKFKDMLNEMLETIVDCTGTTISRLVRSDLFVFRTQSEYLASIN